MSVQEERKAHRKEIAGMLKLQHRDFMVNNEIRLWTSFLAASISAGNSLEEAEKQADAAMALTVQRWPH